MTTNDDLDQFLSQFQWSGIKLGLARVKRLLADLGNPHQQVPIIHVAGTNGKGSVCAYLSSILIAAGYRVGRYTSPHLVSWCERICVNNTAIAPEQFLAVLHQIKSVVMSEDDPPSQFEMVTAAAWLYFVHQGVDVAVVEVGLGGRLDATNVCDRPLVSVITSISRDHAHILGNTLAAIATEKAGILKPHCPAVIAPQAPDVEAVLRQRLAELDCPAWFPWDQASGFRFRVTEQQPHGCWVTCQFPASPGTSNSHDHHTTADVTFPLVLPGSVQLINSALAIAAIYVLRQQGWHVDNTAIVQGMATTSWPGRLQWTTYHGHPLLLDGAHNPAGMVALRQYVDSDLGWQPAAIHWVVGMMKRKEHHDMLQALLRAGDRLYLVPVPDAGTADPTELVTLAHQLCPGLHHGQAYADVFAALDLACATAQQNPSSLVVLCGSLYLLGHFLRHSDR
ncbi:MAG: bifunctional folylpolyglutamate synthase/dihydrofolate synthase [Cyanobacteria bacterium]|nr:bifunctional folylpolyglutamate synthase/dihydrofolate synthase [Cyanobacteriota bacterium]MDW8201869.1 folylpolyglutamate synthase/dihydrofolate synthase family protein [Cyanobacteriota bacterium SKYGB_h_bin112]